MTTASTSREVSFRLEGTPYRAEKNIGTGAYGVVCKAFDTVIERQMSWFIRDISQVEERWVAIKKIQRAFAAITLIKRTLRELRILRELRHENIVAVLDMFKAEGIQVSR
jgi:serine/threonine protein kinase